MEQQTQLIIAWIVTAIAANLQVTWRIISFVWSKTKEYDKLVETVNRLKEADEKKTRDLNAAHQKLRELSKE